MPANEDTESKEGKCQKESGATPDQPTVTVTVSPPSSQSTDSTDDTPGQPTVTVTVTAKVQFPGHP